MPMPNEHRCRLIQPMKDAPTRRVNGQRKHEGKAYDVIFQKQDGKWKEQAYAYPSETWTADTARNHCKSHNGIRFEPASKETRQELPAADTAFATPGDNPYVFTMPGAVEFTDQEEGKKNLRLKLYDGKVVKHWFWGNLAFDQKTMRMAKTHNPILFMHDVERRLAVSNTAVFEPEFIMEGRSLKSSTLAQQIKMEMDEGFPFEASLRFDPERSSIEFVKEGESVEINGHTLKGPGTVIRNALIIEGSVCVFGALKNTKSQAFECNPFFKEPLMAEETTKMTVEELTVENFAQVCPELAKKIAEHAATQTIAAAKERFAELQKICGDDAALTVQCFAEGKSPAEASQMKAAKLTAECQRLAAENAALKARKIDPAVTEFSDTAPAPGSQPPAKFDEGKATDAQLKEHFAQTQDLQDRFSSAEAYIAAVRHPAK